MSRGVDEDAGVHGGSDTCLRSHKYSRCQSQVQTARILMPVSGPSSHLPQDAAAHCKSRRVVGCSSRCLCTGCSRKSLLGSVSGCCMWECRRGVLPSDPGQRLGLLSLPLTGTDFQRLALNLPKPQAGDLVLSPYMHTDLGSQGGPSHKPRRGLLM